MRDVSIQVGLDCDFTPCDVQHVAYGKRNYIRFTFGDGSEAITITASQSIMAEMLKRLLARVSPPPADAAKVLYQTSNPNPTPQETIDYFRQSPELRTMAYDVERQIGDDLTDVQRVLQSCQPEDLIGDDGQPVWGARATVARVLGIRDAGSYRRRIDSVMVYLANSTTTTDEPKSTVFSREVA